VSERALIADPVVLSSSQLRRYLESAGFRVSVAHFLDDALERLKIEPVDVFFAVASPEFDGETLCRRAKRLKPRCPVVLVYGSDEEDLAPHAARAMADGYLVEPLRKGTVISCARSMIRVRELVDEIDRFGQPPREPAKAVPSRATGDLAFFKRFLLLEIKRSRRYRLPASLLVVGLDGLKTAALSPKDRGMVGSLTLAGISRGLREIDLALPSGEDRYLVFLPHTARKGALIVAERIRERLVKHRTLERLGVSVGVASFDGTPTKAPLSFGGMMRDATLALKRVQGAGGNGIEVAGEKPKRDRIVIG